MALFEIIKKTKEDQNIIWRYPKSNFNTNSKLIVDESQEALFYSSGKALDLFGPGKYTLETNNIPIIRNFLNIPTGGKTSFTCDVYFIDKTIQKFKWGTSSKVEFLEPIYKFPISIGACGEIRFRVEDSRKFIVKIVGIKKTFDTESVDEFFQDQMLVKVKSYLNNIITKEKICIFEIDGKLDVISKNLEQELTKDFDEYGIKLEKFFLTNIAKPEDDKQYLEFKELFFKKGVLVANAETEKDLSRIDAETEAQNLKIDAEAQATKRSIEGYTYREEKDLEIGKEIAKNDAIGQYTNLGVGLGMISGVSGSVGNKISNTVTGAFSNSSNICSKCGTENKSGAKFCKKCGNSLEIHSMYCINCGEKLDVDSDFCSVCGKKVD